MDDLERELSGIMFTLFLVGTLTFTFNIQLGKAWTGTVYIRADGSIDPSDAPIITYDNVTYTLTDNITSSGDGIVVERDNIVVDGAGYTVQGTMEWSSSGIDLSYRSNVTIKNVGIKRFWFGIEFFKYARNNNVSGNRIINNNIGASLDYESFSNTLSMNNITNNYRGVYLYESSSNSIFMNSITNNYEGFELWGSSSNSIFCNEIIKNNGFGIYLSSSDNNNISLNNITENNGDGIRLSGSSNYNSISGNNITENNGDGVDISSDNNNIFGNSLTNNTGYGVCFLTAHNNVLKNNSMVDNGYNFGFEFISSHCTLQDVDESNTVNGKPIYLIVSRRDMKVPSDAGYVALINSYNITVKGLKLENNGEGLLLINTTNSKITNNNITNNYRGIFLYSSKNNSLFGNKVTNNVNGVQLQYSSGNMLRNNIMVNNRFNFGVQGYKVSNFFQDVDISNTVDGKTIYYLLNLDSATINRSTYQNVGYLALVNSFNVTVEGLELNNNGQGILFINTTNSRITNNNIAVNNLGVYLLDSYNNNILENNITENNGFGVHLEYSDNNNISLNNITNNTWGGVYLFYSSDNRFCHNNFINNTDQVDSSYGSVNTWDDGYPSGGNYWSDYTGVDNYTGPYQDETGSDGIGDTPYVIDENNVDHYPLMYPYGAQTYKLTITTTFGGTTTPSPGTHIYANGTIVEVTAIPNINCSFAYWLLDGANIGSTNPIDVLMTANHTLQAVFTQTTFQLTILTTTDGTTNPLPDTYTYVNGTKVSVTAIPNTGFSFACWLLDGENRTENPITVVMDANHTLEAYFVDDIPPEIGEPVQDPPSDNVQPYQNVTIRVNVTDYGAGIRNVTLWYSLNNGTSWTVLNMTELPIPSNITITYEALIPGYENCIWVSYKIVAYDNAGNNSTKDNNGYGYKYHVIPEFPSAIILPLFIVISIIAVVFAKKTRYKKPKHSQSSPSFLRYSVSQSKM